MSELLSVVIPAYNEGVGIDEALDRTVAALTNAGIAFEIVCIDDGSTDDTLARAQAVSARAPAVRVIQNPQNLGSAETILKGFELSNGELVMHNGVDLPFAPEDTPMVMERMRAGADVVVVQRRNRHAYGILRKITSWINVTILRVFFRSPFRDHNFVQCYRRAVLDQVEVVTRAVGTITPELILKSRRHGFKVETIHCEYHERQHGQSTISIRDVFRSTAELPRLWRAMRKSRSSAAARGR